MLNKIRNAFTNKAPVTAAPEYPSPPECLYCTELDDGFLVAGHIFQKKYALSAPQVPRHFVAFYRTPERLLVPLCYLHHKPYKNVFLVGGACTDGDAFAFVSEQHKELLRSTPGVFYFLLRHAFEKLQDQCEAFFGYCGDPRALEVDLQAGFEATDREYILIYAPNGLSGERRSQLLDEIASLGAF